MSKSVILSPSCTGKSFFIEKNKHRFNNFGLICNEYLSTRNNVFGNIRMSSVSTLLPTGHSLYKSWDDIYKIGVNIFNNDESFNDKVLLYNSTSHVRFLLENYPEIKIKIVLIDEETHKNNFIKKWSEVKETKKTLIELIEESNNILNMGLLFSWNYICQEVEVYRNLSTKYNIKIYDSFESTFN